MGGKRTKIVQATPPPAPPAPTTASGIKEFVAAQPQLFALQQQQAPLEAQQQLELTQKFAGPMALALRKAQEQLSPQATALTEQLAGIASNELQGNLPQEEQDKLLRDFQAAVGPNALSPVAGRDFARILSEQRLQRQMAARNLGLSIAGFTPIPQPSTPSFSNFAGSLTPGQVLSNRMQGFQSRLAFNRPQFFQQQKPDYLTGVGNVLQGIGSFIPG